MVPLQLVLMSLFFPSRPSPDPADSQAKNQSDPKRQAHRFEGLALYTMNGLRIQVSEFFDAAPDRLDRPLRGVNAIIDGVGRKRLQQPRLV